MSQRTQLIEELLHCLHGFRNIIKNKALHLEHQNHITHSQWFVLTMIGHFEKRSVKDIAQAMEMSSSAATQLVEPLVKAGLVLRQEDPKDRRLLQLELSPEGKKHIEHTKEHRINEMAGIFDSLTDKELEEFVRLHKIIMSNFSKEGEKDNE